MGKMKTHASQADDPVWNHKASPAALGSSNQTIVAPAGSSAQMSLPFTESSASTVVHQPLKLKIIGARGLRDSDWFMGSSDAYVVCEIPNKPNSKVKTNVSQDGDPMWNHEAKITGYIVGDSLSFTVWDDDTYKDDIIGKVVLDSAKFNPGGFEGELPLEDPANKGRKAFLRIKVGTASVGGAGESEREGKCLSSDQKVAEAMVAATCGGDGSRECVEETTKAVEGNVQNFAASDAPAPTVMAATAPTSVLVSAAAAKVATNKWWRPGRKRNKT